MDKKLEEFYKRKLNERNNAVHELKEELEEFYKERELLLVRHESRLEELRKEIRKESEARKRAAEMVQRLNQEVEELRFRERNINGMIRQVVSQNRYGFVIVELENLKKVADVACKTYGWIPKYVMQGEIQRLIDKLRET